MRRTKSLIAFFLVISLGASLTSSLRAQSSLATSQTGAPDLAVGYCFDLSATSNLTVDSFDVIAENAFYPSFFEIPEFMMEVWVVKGTGSYAGHIGKGGDWERVALVSGINLAQPSATVALNAQFGVFMTAGETRGFCITRTNAGRILGFPAPLGSVAVSNSDLSLLTGRIDSPYQIYPLYSSYPAITIHYSPHPVNPIDLELKEIVNPTSSGDCLQLGLETTTIELRQLGTVTIPAGTVINLSLSVDGGAAQSESLVTTTALAPGQSLTHTLTSLLNLSAIGSHTVSVSATVPGDGFAANDQRSKEVWSAGVARVSTFPWTEDFDSVPQGTLSTPPTGWEQDYQDATGILSDWNFGRASTRPGSTAIPSDHTTGIPNMGGYTYVRNDSDFAAVRLLSPCLDLTNVQEPRLSFWISMVDSSLLSGSIPAVSVDVLELPSMTLHTDVFGPYTGYGNFAAGKPWRFLQESLSSFSGKVIRLVFRVTTIGGNPNNSSSYDCIVDDVQVIDALATPGQNEQPGLAVFELGDPLNINGDPLYAETGGPYYTSLSEGDPLTFTFEGQPNQAIYLLFGFLNPVSATFPNVGQMDIGNTINPLTGLPNGIAILADGTNPIGFNPLFVTNSLGKMQFSMVMPLYPPGFIVGAFQAAITTGGLNGSWVALSNAIQLSSN